MSLRINTILLVLFIYSLGSHSQSKNLTNSPLYLIIVSDNYADNPSLQLFKNFRSQDFNVQTVTGTSIGTTKDDFRNYIRDLMPGYVLLVGKYGDFPVHVIDYPASTIESYNYYVASSLSGHPTPDIPLGLFFAEDETELANIINKTISYETNLASYPKEYYAHAGSVEALPPWPVVEFNEEILTEMNDRYFALNGYDFTLATAYDDTPNDRWTDVEMINNGIHFMIYHGHGLIHKWSFGMGVPGLPQLNNTVYPIILSFACLTGSFSGEIGEHTNDCFAQKMVANEHGAAAFLGSFHTSGRGMNQLLEGMVNAFFNDRIADRLGDAMIYGFANTKNTNTVNKYYPTVQMVERIRTAWQFHLFGDPALWINRDRFTGSGDVLQDNDLVKIYPNPAIDFFKIEVNSKYKQLEFTLYNPDGRLLFKTKNETEIKTSHLKNGIYIAAVKLDEKMSVKRIIKIAE
jgi:hypothetical protein